MKRRASTPRPAPSRFLRRLAAGFAVGALCWVGVMAPALAQSRVQVLYAGSLVALMEQSVGPAFARATGFHFDGYAGGSTALAEQIKGRLRPADVFISANPSVNALLMGKKNGNWLDRYVSFARSPLVIGYNPASRFARNFRTRPWLTVLQERGLRIGRTDPRLDPKGRLTLTFLARAATMYREPKLVAQIFGAPENPAQVLPEEELIGRLQSGQIDAGFFYALETSEAHIPSVALPKAIAPYATYTVGILNRAPHEKAARAFVSFLLGPKGRQILTDNGLELIQPHHQDTGGRPSRPQSGMGAHAP